MGRKLWAGQEAGAEGWGRSRSMVQTQAESLVLIPADLPCTRVTGLSPFALLGLSFLSFPEKR